MSVQAVSNNNVPQNLDSGLSPQQIAEANYFHSAVLPFEQRGWPIPAAMANAINAFLATLPTDQDKAQALAIIYAPPQ